MYNTNSVIYTTLPENSHGKLMKKFHDGASNFSLKLSQACRYLCDLIFRWARPISYQYIAWHMRFWIFFCRSFLFLLKSCSTVWSYSEKHNSFTKRVLVNFSSFCMLLLSWIVLGLWKDSIGWWIGIKQFLYYMKVC